MTNDQNKPKSTYHSYILRVWKESDASKWRYMLRSAADEQEHFFTTAEELAAFICDNNIQLEQ